MEKEELWSADSGACRARPARLPARSGETHCGWRGRTARRPRPRSARTRRFRCAPGCSGGRPQTKGGVPVSGAVRALPGRSVLRLRQGLGRPQRLRRGVAEGCRRGRGCLGARPVTVATVIRDGHDLHGHRGRLVDYRGAADHRGARARPRDPLRCGRRCGYPARHPEPGLERARRVSPGRTPLPSQAAPRTYSVEGRTAGVDVCAAAAAPAGSGSARLAIFRERLAGEDDRLGRRSAGSLLIGFRCLYAVESARRGKSARGTEAARAAIAISFTSRGPRSLELRPRKVWSPELWSREARSGREVSAAGTGSTGWLLEERASGTDGSEEAWR